MQKPQYNPPSANGFCLRVVTDRAVWFLTASWRAPYFALVGEYDEDGPMLVHCDDWQHAQACQKNGARLFDSAFLPVMM